MLDFCFLNFDGFSLPDFSLLQGTEKSNRITRVALGLFVLLFSLNGFAVGSADQDISDDGPAIKAHGSREIGETNETREIGETNETREIGETNETREIGETNETREIGETNETREIGETNETREIGETNETREAGETNETREAGETNETREAGETNETREVFPWGDPFKEALALVKAYKKLDKSQKSFGYKSFEIIFDHIGPVTFTPRNEADGEKPSLSSKLQQEAGGVGLSPESVRMFLKKAQFFKTQMTPEAIKKFHQFQHNISKGSRIGASPEAISISLQDTVLEQAQKIVMELMVLANHPEAYRNDQLAQLYRSNQYRVLKSMKTGFVHLPAEIFRFTTAIIIVRLATCFGPSMWNSMSFKPVAKDTDPACLTELAEMLLDPIFYAGFSAFVLASRGSTPVLLKALRKIDPKYGPVSRATARQVIPHFSMAIGFIADHILRSLLQNKDIQQCLVSLTGGGRRQKFLFPLNKDLSSGTVTDENEEEFQVYDYYQSVGGAPCRRAGKYISSDQFLKEELGVGITSLVSAAVSLSVVGAGTSKLIQMSTARLSATLASRITIVLSVTGPIGLIIGTGRMVAFLSLSELITPYVISTYYLNFMEPKVDDKAKSFISKYGKISVSKNREKDLARSFENNLQEVSLNSRKRSRTKSSKRHCAEYYSGYQPEANEPLCTAIPLLTEIMSFHDYSKTWREKKILGKFNMAVSRWKKKLTGFFDSYDSSREQIRYLTRGREIYLTGQSEEQNLIKEQFRDTAFEILGEEEGLSPGEIESVLDDIYGEVLQQEMDPEYTSPVMDLESPNPPYPHPRRMAFEFLRIILDEELNFRLNMEGSYYYGIYGRNNDPDSNEVTHLINQMIEFIDMGPVTIRNYSWPQDKILPYNVRKDLEALGLPPELSHYPFLMESLRRLLTSEIEEDRVYGLILFKNWGPFMSGPIRSSMYNPPSPDSMGSVDERIQRRPMGFVKEEQSSLYESLSEALKHHDPLFKYEYIYLNGAIFSALGKKTKEESPTQWSQSYQGFDTSELYAYSLTHLICGSEGGKGIGFFSGDREGLAFEFRFPHLLKGNICKNLYQPVYDQDGNSSKPSVLRSQMTSPEVLYAGLHQVYIQAPEDENNPLLFKTEAQAQKWWDENILPENIQRLGAMKEAYSQMVKEEFTPHLRRQEPVEAGSGWERFQRDFFFWVDDGTEQEAGVYTSTESLTVSIINELSHYHRAILSLVDPSVKSEMDGKLKNLSHCFLKLLESIPGKKYMEAEKQCKESLGSVIRYVTYQNGVLDQRQVEQLFRIDDNQLSVLDDEQRGVLIRNRILVELGRTLGFLYEEIFTYNQVVNNLFNFNLEKESESEVEEESE